MIIKRLKSRVGRVELRLPPVSEEKCCDCNDRFGCWTTTISPTWVTQSDETFNARFVLPLCTSLDYIREVINTDNFVKVDGTRTKVDSYSVDVSKNLKTFYEVGSDEAEFANGKEELELTVTCVMSPIVKLYD